MSAVVAVTAPRALLATFRNEKLGKVIQSVVRIVYPAGEPLVEFDRTREWIGASERWRSLFRARISLDFVAGTDIPSPSAICVVEYSSDHCNSTTSRNKPGKR